MKFCTTPHSNAFSQKDKDVLLILQCDSGHLNGDLVACARYRIDDERERANSGEQVESGTETSNKDEAELKEEIDGDQVSKAEGEAFNGDQVEVLEGVPADVPQNNTSDEEGSERPLQDVPSLHHSTRQREPRVDVLLVIQLPRRALETPGSSFISFQGGSWISMHMDSLSVPKEGVPTVDEVLETSVSELFYSFGECPSDRESGTTGGTPRQYSQCQRLYDCIRSTVAHLTKKHTVEKEDKWKAKRVELLMELIPKETCPELGMCVFGLMFWG